MANCDNCSDKCPQAELAHNTALGRMYATNEFVKLVKKIESGELVEVAHGRWILEFYSYSTPKCSICGWSMPYSEDSFLDARNYCPNCGARMDLEE